MNTLRSRTILLALAGSHAHGTARGQSDIDLAGVAIPTRSEVLGLFDVFEQANDTDSLSQFTADLSEAERLRAGESKLEGTVFGLQKFMRLAATANPNILELMFTRESEFRRLDSLGQQLLSQRNVFVTAKCKDTFGGYAASQLGRIQLHYRWHTAGPKTPPSRSEFGLPDKTLIPRQQIDAAESAIRRQLDSWELDLSELDASTRIQVETRVATTLTEWNLAGDDSRWNAAARWVGLDDNLIEVMLQERKWRTARNEWQRYRGWLKNRNPARAKLEAQFGYDTKHGAHLVRLLRMGMEIAETGKVHVWRGDRDADELAAIRD